MRSSIGRRIYDNTPPETKQFVRKYADIVVRINQLLKEKGITRLELAKRMDKSPSEISKWLSGDHNLTLKTMTKLETELGADIIYIPKKVSITTLSHTKVSFTIVRKIPANEGLRFQSGTRDSGEASLKKLVS